MTTNTTHSQRRKTDTVPEQSHQIGHQEAGVKLVDYLSATLGLSLRKAKGLLDDRAVFVNGRRVWMAKHILKKGDSVDIEAAPAPAARRGRTPSVLFENQNYLVVNKPSGILSNGEESLETQMQSAYGASVRAVHRLDKDTSGALCFARGTRAFERAVDCFKEGRVLKVYQAVVSGRPRTRKGTITKPLEGQPAVTHWTVLAASDRAAHLQIKIDTGRTHQIRKHLSGIGHPVLGDRQYFTHRDSDPRVRAVPRQMLHAAVFQAPLGTNQQRIRVEAPLPPDFRKLLHQFGLDVETRGIRG